MTCLLVWRDLCFVSTSRRSIVHVACPGFGFETGPCPCARMSVSRATPRLLSDVCNFPCPVPYARSSSSMHKPRAPESRPTICAAAELHPVDDPLAPSLMAAHPLPLLASSRFMRGGGGRQLSLHAYDAAQWSTTKPSSRSMASSAAGAAASYGL
jgi:hypothetical protein